MADAQQFPRTGPRRRARRIAARTAAGTVLLCALALAVLWLRWDGNLTGVDIDGALGTDRPADVGNGSLDLLVLGSDSRSGGNRAYGGTIEDGARSDTAMIVHLHEGHRRATVVSVPRDTIVDRPACREPDGSVTPAEAGVMFNDAFAVGGPACAVKTAESLTGIRMDHYIEVDFVGFRDLVDALGGVPLTVREPIRDRRSHLDLDAGTRTLSGTEALGLVRTRHGVGDGSDLGRIRLQQAFVKALMDRVDGLGVLTHPATLYRLGDAATEALTTDSALASISALTGLAKSVRELDSEDVTMLTLPVAYDPYDPNRVIPLERQAERVWSALRSDQAVPRSATEGSAAEQTAAEGAVGTAR